MSPASLILASTSRDEVRIRAAIGAAQFGLLVAVSRSLVQRAAQGWQDGCNGGEVRYSTRMERMSGVTRYQQSRWRKFDQVVRMKVEG